MPTRERKADFETADFGVDGASTERRPDAVSSDYLVNFAPGPRAVGDASMGMFARAWRVRADHDDGEVRLARGDASGSRWQPEALLLDFSPANAIRQVALAFDPVGDPQVAAERADGFIWVSRAASPFVSITAGRTPVFATFQDPADLGVESVLFYIRGGELHWRTSIDDYASEHPTGILKGDNEFLERHVIDVDGRLHLEFSTRDPEAGTYTLDWLSQETATGFVLGACAQQDDGVDSYHILAQNGTINPTEETAIEVLLQGGGGLPGHNGVGASGKDAILWADLDGNPLDPEVDTPPPEHIAQGGGGGGWGEANGVSGGNGGGAGASSPNSVGGFFSGGGGAGPGSIWQGGSGQGNPFGTFKRNVATGGGGGSGGHGQAGTVFGGLKAGLGGVAGRVPGWPIDGGRGGNGSKIAATPEDPPQNLGGGGAAGQIKAVTVTVSEPIRITVPGGNCTPINEEWGSGGDAGGDGNGEGRPPIVIVRHRREELLPAWAEITGGTLVTRFGWHYRVFRASVTAPLVTPGRAEAIVIPGGGGGGSGLGGGGGAGSARRADLNVTDDLDIVVGAGGAGGVAGAHGADGGSSEIVGHITVPGGGGGAGQTQGGAGSSGAAGGGGHGPDGLPGDGTLLRGQRGGEGTSYPLSGGGSEGWAGGGGGQAREGQRGATVENVGDPLDADWDTSAAGWSVDVARARLTVTTSTDGNRIWRSGVSRGKMFVQALIRGTNQIAAAQVNGVGLAVRLATDAATGIVLSVVQGVSGGQGRAELTSVVAGTHTTLQSSGNGSLNPAADHYVQVYADDGLQEAWVSGLKLSGSSSAHDGQNDRSAGFLIRRNTGILTCEADDFLLCPDKFVFVSGLSTGWRAQVLNAAGEVIAEATEVAGVASVDPTRFNNTPELVPFDDDGPIGWQSVRVVDGGGATQGEYANGGVFPGLTFDYSAGVVSIVPDFPLADVPLASPVAADSFDGIVPGPEHGDGGEGVDLREWLLPANVLEGHFNGAASWDAPGTAAVMDAVMEFRPNNVSTSKRVRLVLRGGASGTNGYVAELRGTTASSFGQFRIGEFVAGAFSQLGAAVVAFGATDKIRMRFRASGTALKAKIWLAASAEPGTWNVEVTDASFASGWFGTSTVIAGTEVSYLAVAVGGDVAPLPEEATGDAFVTFFADGVAGQEPGDWTPRWGSSAVPWRVLAWPDTILIAPVVAGDELWFSGGGGGASEGPFAGVGGRGGGGDGTSSAAADGGAGLNDTGGGGGGSRSTGQAGGAGGDGIVVVRTRIA